MRTQERNQIRRNFAQEVSMEVVAAITSDRVERGSDDNLQVRKITRRVCIAGINNCIAEAVLKNLHSDAKGRGFWLARAWAYAKFIGWDIRAKINLNLQVREGSVLSFAIVTPSKTAAA